MSDHQKRLEAILAGAKRQDEQQAQREAEVARVNEQTRAKADQFLSRFHEKREQVIIPTLDNLVRQLAAAGHDCHLVDHSHSGDHAQPRIDFTVCRKTETAAGRVGQLAFACLAFDAVVMVYDSTLKGSTRETERCGLDQVTEDLVMKRAVDCIERAFRA